jgi:zinc transport system permease protein
VSPLDDFVLRAGLAGLATAAAAGPLGCFVVWRRLAYFGDATAHASILGVALSLSLGVPVAAGVLVAALGMALAVDRAARAYAMDTALGVAAHAALAGGLVVLAFLPGQRLDLMGYLFGDVLAVTREDLALIGGGAALIAGLLAWRWRRLLTATLSGELAAAEGIDPGRERLVLILALALLVAVALKVVGALLITAMLIIPAAVARALAGTPEAMAVLAVAAGGLAVAGGLWGSLAFDTPAGPSIVVAAVGLFLAANLARGIARRDG